MSLTAYNTALNVVAGVQVFALGVLTFFCIRALRGKMLRVGMFFYVAAGVAFVFAAIVACFQHEEPQEVSTLPGWTIYEEPVVNVAFVSTGQVETKAGRAVFVAREQSKKTLGSLLKFACGPSKMGRHGPTSPDCYEVGMTIKIPVDHTRSPVQSMLSFILVIPGVIAQGRKRSNWDEAELLDAKRRANDEAYEQKLQDRADTKAAELALAISEAEQALNAFMTEHGDQAKRLFEQRGRIEIVRTEKGPKIDPYKLYYFSKDGFCLEEGIHGYWAGFGDYREPRAEKTTPVSIRQVVEAYATIGEAAGNPRKVRKLASWLQGQISARL